MQGQFDQYTRPGVYAKNIETIINWLKVHADNTAVKEEPWKELATQAGERGEGAEQSSGYAAAWV